MNNGYPTQKNPKHSSYIKNIKEGLEKAGHKVDLCVLDSNFKNKIQHIRNYLKFYIHVFQKDFSNYDYVFIHHYGHFAIPLLKSLKKIKQPVIHWHGEDLFPASTIMDKLFKIAMAKLPDHTKHITPSFYFQKQLSNKYNIPLSQISVSPSGGINIHHFSQLTDFKKEKHDYNTVRIGFASGLSKEKGADFILHLLNSIDNLESSLQKKFEFHFIFYGKEKDKYTPLFCAYKNTVKWQVMSASEMPKFYQTLDLLLFPSRRKQESLGLVALEAMSCGCPVIGTDDFAVKEYIVSGVSGERFAMNDFNDFTTKLIHVVQYIKNYSPRKVIIERYSQESVINFYKNFFH